MSEGLLRSWRSALLLSAGASLLAAEPAWSQTQLPGIVVTTPSPIVRPRRPAAPSPTADVPPQPAAPLPPAAPPGTESPALAAAPPIPADAIPPGTTIIVDDAFVSVTVLPRSEIESIRAHSIGDAIAHKPGITTSNFAPGASRPIIRGLDNFRVRVQENGIGSHDVSAISEDHAVPIDPLAAEQIEVVRGPATLRYGSQAIGGVVSSVNNRIPDHIPERGVRFRATGGLSTVDDGRDGSLSLDVGGGPIALHVDTFKRLAKDYKTPQGIQLNTGVEAEGYSVGGSVIGRGGYFGIAYTHFASLYHIPGVEAAEKKLRIDLQSEKWTSKGELRPNAYGIEAIRTWFGVTHYKHDEISEEGGVTGIGSTFLNNEREGRIEIQHMPAITVIGKLTGVVGGQWGSRNLSAAGEGGELLAPSTTERQALFIFEELEVTSRLRLQAAGRMETTRIKGTFADFPPGFEPPPDEPDEIAARRKFNARSVSLGGLYELPLGVVARVTGQYVERAPDVAELFSKGPHEATATFEIGDPNLKIEKAQTIEVGLRKAKGAFRFDMAAYRTEYQGFIFKNFTGLTCDDDFASCGAGGGTELKQIVYSQRDATFTGAEVQGELDVLPIWRGVVGIHGQYDFVRAKFSNGENVPRIPPHRLGGGLYYRDANLHARAGVLHAFRQDKIGAEETPTSSYTLVNAEIGYTWKLDPKAFLVPEIMIGLKGENLADDDVRNHVSFKKDEVLLPGRSVRVFGHIKLN